jgi:hypothetical protein
MHSDSHKILLEVYLKGFKDELEGIIFYVQENELLSTAYNLGRDHALIGDDIESIDYLTDEEILNLILNN